MIGSITKCGNKFRAYYSLAGKRISKRCDTREEAENWLAECRTNVVNGTYVEPSKMTFGEWVIEYLETYAKHEVKISTLTNYKSKAKKLAPLANIKLQNLSPMHLQKIINNEKSDANKFALYLLMSTIIRKAVKLRLITYDIMTPLSVPKYNPKRKEIFTDEEWQKIKKVLPKFKHGNLFLTMMATGCRLGEIMALTIDDVHKNYIHIEKTLVHCKNTIGTPKSLSSIRDVTVPESIINMLKAEWAKTSVLHGYIFTNDEDNHLSCSNIRSMWQRILKAANVPYRSAHYIRHTHATNLLHKFDYVEVQHRLGHSKASITLDIYGHIKKETNNAIVKAVNDMI